MLVAAKSRVSGRRFPAAVQSEDRLMSQKQDGVISCE